VHEGRNEVPCSVVERDVVWMRGDASFVKSDENVDRGGGCICRFLRHGFREIGREERGEEVGDLLLVPRGRHAIREIPSQSLALVLHHK
jgi:hypothetical protein